MQKAIGKTFVNELAAAGLLGLPFTWGADGVIEFGQNITTEQRDAVLAVYDAHDPTAVVVTVPAAVSRFKARAALYNAGHFAAVEAIMADPATPMLYKLAWSDAQEFERGSATVAAIGAALGLDGAALDALFIAANSITA